MEERYIYKKGIRIEVSGRTIWHCQGCFKSKRCCEYSSERTFTKEQYQFQCPFYVTVDEEGILCRMPQSIDFIMGD